MFVNEKYTPQPVLRSEIKEDNVYVPLSRLILAIDDVSTQEELSRGFAHYKTKINGARCYLIPKNDSIPHYIIEQEEMIVPLFEIATNMTFKNAEINKNPTIIEDSCKSTAISMQYQEDAEVLKVLNAAVVPDHSIEWHQSSDYFDFLKKINHAMAIIEEHDNEVAYIIMHHLTFEYLRLVDFKHLYIFKDYEQFKNIKGTKVRGMFFNVPIITSCMVPKNVVYVTASPEQLGYIVIPEDINKGDIIQNVDKKRKECVMSEKVGICCIYECAVSRIIVYKSDLVSQDSEIKQQSFTEQVKLNEEVKLLREALEKITNNKEEIPKKRTVFGWLKK